MPAGCQTQDVEELVRELAVETLDQTWCCATLGHFESSDSANSLLSLLRLAATDPSRLGDEPASATDDLSCDRLLSRFPGEL